MTTQWVHFTVLRAASLLAPGDQRAEWVKEWQSELWYIPRRGATRFCLGAFRDALWLRRNNLRLEKRTGAFLESPFICLAFLIALAAVGTMIAAGLLGPLAQRTTYWHLRARDLPGGFLMTLVLSCVLLPAIMAVGREDYNHHPGREPGKLRRWIFLALKIALVQPLMLCGLFIWILIGPVVPITPLVILAAWMLTLRWVITDQRRRCPVCLRLLTNPVRIGSLSQTFLEWYGEESMCQRGHGLMHVSDPVASYSRNAQWLTLDESWSGLFPADTRGRHS